MKGTSGSPEGHGPAIPVRVEWSVLSHDLHVTATSSRDVSMVLKTTTGASVPSLATEQLPRQTLKQQLLVRAVPRNVFLLSSEG